MLRWIDDESPLPLPEEALGDDTDAPGLVAAGGLVTPERLEQAYRQGIFPWYGPGQPALWWSPDPRMVLPVADFQLSHSLRKTLRRFLRTPGCAVHFDRDFDRVITACAQTPREGQDGTWIVPPVLQAYSAWHHAGRVHSAETWVGDELVGGLYFVHLGGMVYGESMFAHRTDASKIALAALVAACRVRGIALIDCQQKTGHLASLGAREWPRREFLTHVRRVVPAQAAADAPAAEDTWTYDESAWDALHPGLRPRAVDPPAHTLPDPPPPNSPQPPA
jgi:leucyl/phenylalanyl-tRNA--protein transferase